MKDGETTFQNANYFKRWFFSKNNPTRTEVAGSNLGRGYFVPRSTHPSILPGSVNEYQLRLGRQRQIWLIRPVDETQDVQVKLCYPLTMSAIPECLRDVLCAGTKQIDYL